MKNWIYLFGLLSITGLFACTAPPQKTYLGEANIRIVNAVPETFNLTFFVNDTSKTPSPLKFADSSLNQKVNAGTKNIYTKTNGNIINKSNLTLLLLNNENYTVFIAGKISKDSISYISTQDDITLPTAGKAKVRFINTSPNSISLDMVFSTKAIDSLATFGNIGFRAGSNYTEFSPGNYFIKVKQTGGKTLLVDKPNISIKANKIYTFWAKGLLNATGTYKLDIGLLNDN